MDFVPLRSDLQIVDSLVRTTNASTSLLILQKVGALVAMRVCILSPKPLQEFFTSTYIFASTVGAQLLETVTQILVFSS